VTHVTDFGSDNTKSIHLQCRWIKHGLEAESPNCTDLDGRLNVDAALTMTPRSADAELTRADRGRALGWLVRQLAWEKQLDNIRHREHPMTARHEAA
jgi:hypothetical protein